MLIKTKKGTFIYWTVFAMAVAIAIYLYSQSGPVEPEEYKGILPISLIKTSYIAENKLLYIDLAAKFSAGKSIASLAENGGFYNNSPCGRVKGYNLWNNETKTCIYKQDKIKEKTQENFFRLFENTLKRYLDNPSFKYGSWSLTEKSDVYANFGDINYMFSIENKKLIGLNNDDVFVFDIYANKAPKARYSANPSFSIDIDYDFDDYAELREQADFLVAECRGINDTFWCVKEKIKTRNFGLTVNECINETCLFNSVSALGEERIEYKLALYFGNQTTRT